MSNCNITFGVLKSIFDSTRKKNSGVLVDFLNSFEGENVFDKFKNILIAWESDVSYTWSLNLEDAPAKIQLAYIISELPSSLGMPMTIEKDEICITLDIPNNFTHESGVLPIYSIIQQIKISDIFINLINLPVCEKQQVINSLPAKAYNIITSCISKETSKIVTFGNPNLKKLKFNFLTNDPYNFLSGLFTKYGDEYFRDVIYHLSKRIDGKLLLDSTPMDIEYYMEKYTTEMNSQNSQLTI